MSDDGIDWKMEAIRGNRLHAAEEQKCLALTARIEALEAALRERDELIRLMRRSGSRKPNPQPNLRGSAALSRPVEAAPVAEGLKSDGIRERGRYYDIIIWALVEYDGWMLDDDYEAMPVLHRIMKRMRERLEMSALSRPIEPAPVAEGLEALLLLPVEAINALESHQRQIDRDGVEVGVSRQAVDEIVAAVKKARAALDPSSPPKAST